MRLRLRSLYKQLPVDLSHPQGVGGELTTMATPQEIVDARPAVFDALDFEAPYLVEKLVKDRVVDSAEQGSALFTEVKRYLVLNQVDVRVGDLVSIDDPVTELRIETSS